MKIKRTIEQVEITGITLLSIDEAEMLPTRLREYNGWWWLRSRGDHSTCAATVINDGSVIDYGGYIYCDGIAVRPALTVKSSNLEIGDIICLGGKEWEVINDKYAFCTTNIGFHGFDGNSNDYDKSEIKQFVESWLKKEKSDN